MGTGLGWGAGSANNGTLEGCELNRPRDVGGLAGSATEGISSKAGAKEGVGLKDSKAGGVKGLGVGLNSDTGENVMAGWGAGDWPSNWALLKPDSAGALGASDPVGDAEAAKGSNGFVTGARGDEGWAGGGLPKGEAWPPKGGNALVSGRDGEEGAACGVAGKRGCDIGAA